MLKVSPLPPRHLHDAEAREHRLLELATALSSQTTLDTLLSLLLAECRNLAQADAGSLYVREKAAPGGKLADTLRFKISQNDSVNVSQATEFLLPIDDCSGAGYVALTGTVQNIPDVQNLSPNAPYTYDADWDRKFNYHVKSMLAVPLTNLTGSVVGVLQLINKKNTDTLLQTARGAETTICAFSADDEALVRSIGSLAAVSIERVQLYSEIADIFEGYLHSSIAAIDERDSITSGHSRRVMDYALAFADAVNADTEGCFTDIVFSEARKKQFRFAALLHDIGKIGVPEELLKKETRLSPSHMDALRSRVDYIRLLMRHFPSADVCSWKSEQELASDFALLEHINFVYFLPDTIAGQLNTICEKTYQTADGIRRNFLTSEEWEALSVCKGNLTAHERELVNSHTLATRRILSGIPWTQELKDIPLIAAHHHEKIDGSGYPDRLSGDQICFESRALAVIDIYESLTARDRPYKPRMPAEEAIAIIRAEAAAGHLDTRIVEFFITRNIYKRAQTSIDV